VKTDDVWIGCVTASLLFIALITVGRNVFGDMTNWGPHVRRVVVFRIDAIGYGFLLYLIFQRVSISWNNFSRWAALGLLFATAGLVVFINIRMLNDDATWLKRAFPFAAAAFDVSAVVSFLSLNFLFSSRQLTAVCTFLGRISYPVYLFHLIALYLLSSLGLVYGLTGVLVYLAVVVVSSALFNYGFEQPILSARPHYKFRTSEPLMGIRAP
jgi:peptidoglycan/LPS O-acetylase OafA/YrhL